MNFQHHDFNKLHYYIQVYPTYNTYITLQKTKTMVAKITLGVKMPNC